MIPGQDSYRVIGLMSGSSLDGVDLAYCHFWLEDGAWRFTIDHTACIPYDAAWLQRLRIARDLNGRSLWQLHSSYGHLLGDIIKDFVSSYGLTGRVDLIASHGHTVFHYPGQHFTTQIGDGAAIAAITGIPVVCDLRATDVALGGSGAPIVPIGDKLLFPGYPYLLNIGGIANITIKNDAGIKAFDICAANQVLNHYAQQQGHEFDVNGHMAARGRIDSALLEALNGLDYYAKPAPKSLDNGFTAEIVLPIIEQYAISIDDKLATYTEHIAMQVRAQIGLAHSADHLPGQMLITGGGAFNTHLVQRIEHHAGIPVVVPSAQIVSYKEALVMALIGVLRMRGEVNILHAVTGAARDAIGGAVYLP